MKLKRNISFGVNWWLKKGRKVSIENGTEVLGAKIGFPETVGEDGRILGNQDQNDTSFGPTRGRREDLRPAKTTCRFVKNKSKKIKFK